MSKILIIEDEEAIADLEKDYLTLSGYEVEIALDGREGLKKAKSGSYDLFLIDVMLPGADGFEIIQLLRKETSVPIMVVSARRDDIDKIRGLGLGADDYMTKPFSPGELVARVNAHLSGYERVARSFLGTEEMLSAGNLKVNTKSHTLMVGDEKTDLTAKEYELLCFFLRHPNQVFSKEELFQKVWNKDSIGDNHTVIIYVKKLREKLEKDPANPKYLETVWGMGYRLCV